MPMLQFHDGARQLFVHVVRGSRTIVGRADSCDLALPSDNVSRVHFIIDRRGDKWVLLDRSRNGTQVNGRLVTECELDDQDEIDLGNCAARFLLADLTSAPTKTAPLRLVVHEELVTGDADAVTTTRATVRIMRGPLAGQTVELGAALCSVGGPGATVELDVKLPRDSALLRVVRGRVMISPGSVPVFLTGQRVTELTPVYIGEEVRLGDHGFVIELRHHEDRATVMQAFGEMVATSPVMQQLFGVLRRMSAHDAPVLLYGESGTGKELAAHAIHASSARFEGPFVALNCAAIAETLFESELFGHEKGAFTGANARADGAFHRADGGTLFLDEIGELTAELQAKLLRVLESGEVRRVGGAAPEYPDVRLVTATNRNLLEMVRQGTFRQDLYFRIAVLAVRIPSLRERPEDIPLLATTLLERHHPGAALTPDALEKLTPYAWPGNVRELRNVLTRAVVMYGANVTAHSIEFQQWSFEDRGEESQEQKWSDPNEAPEREAIALALAQANGNRTRAAHILGMPRSSLLYKIVKYGLGSK
jgi:transcriptional regulator with AAA-type ATPase domain